MSLRPGIVYQSPGQSALEHLPLEKVAVRAWIVDVSARVLLTQVFRNTSERPTAKAKYVFPLPERSAVCAFELEHADGRVLVGAVKERDDAARTFDAEVAAGRAAGLVERVTDDIFAISIGSIPGNGQVIARISFVMDLLNEGVRDHVRLQLPLAIFERYGPIPEAMVDAATATTITCVDIRVDIQTSGTIYAVRSPSHPIKELWYKTRQGRRSRRRRSASWMSSSFLEQDFVLTVHADGLDEPRCFAEVAAETEYRAAGTIALQLTLVPSFQVPRVPSQEYIFIIDTSGSMDGSRMNTAKDTLSMLLRLLPSDQTIFNIFKFGTYASGLWNVSRALDQTSLNEAITHVQEITADGGTTEIANALRVAIGTRVSGRPTAVFLLTDGQAYDLQVALDIVSNSVNNAPPQAPLRVFVLGIEEASSATCESIARAGNGECFFAVKRDEILGKCARLLNAGRTRKVERINVDWGGESASGEPGSQNVASPRHSLPADTLKLEPPPAIQQMPYILNHIFAGIRFTVFAIISSVQFPSSVKVSTKFEGRDELVEYEVKVREALPFKNADSEIPLVHTLAARKLITELDEGRTPLPAVISPVVASDEEIRKAAVVRVGLEYQLASRYTSFVAIEAGRERPRSQIAGRGKRDTSWTRWRRPRRRRMSPQQVEQEQGSVAPEDDSLLGSVIDALTSAFSFVFGPFRDAPQSSPTPQVHQGIPGTYVGSDSTLAEDDSGRSPSPSGRRRSISRRNSADTFSTLSSLEGSCSSCWTSSRPPSPQPPVADPIERAPSPQFVYERTQRQPAAAQAPPPPLDPSASASAASAVPRDAYDAFQLLGLDGSFAPSAELKRIVGDGILDKADELGVDATLWSTIVAVAWLQKHLQEEPDLLDALRAKAEDFIKGAVAARGSGKFSGSIGEMIRYALELLEGGGGS